MPDTEPVYVTAPAGPTAPKLMELPFIFPVTVVVALWPLYEILIEPCSFDPVCVQCSLNVP